MRALPLLLLLTAAACSAPPTHDEAPATTPLGTAPADPTTPGGAGAKTDTAAGAPAADAPPCGAPTACEAPQLAFAPRGFQHSFTSSVVTASGSARHRGRDLFVNPGEPQTIIGKFAYGANDKDLHGEEVDVFVQRGCAKEWEKLGTATTTDDGAHATVEGVEDDGGRVYFPIPADKALGPGRHRVRLVVAGDGTSADAFIEVVAKSTPMFVSDVDGTLTSSETVEASALLTGATPETHEGAPEALRALAAKGYRPMYLTARPEWLTQRTREFLAERGFPDGIVHTSTTTTGVFGSAAAEYKSNEMALLAAKGLVPAFGFGNQPSDSQAYTSIVDPQHRVFYQITGEFTGRRIESYTELLAGFAALPAVCK